MKKTTKSQKTMSRTSKAQARAKAKPARKPSMFQVARELILAGKTNEEVTAVLMKDWKLPAKHKHYAGWFRSALIRELKAEKVPAKKLDFIRAHAHKESKKEAPAGQPAKA